MSRSQELCTKPVRLGAGETIGIVAPSSPLAPQALERALNAFASLNYPVKIGHSVQYSYGYLSGSDVQRAADLNEMFADPQVRAVFCLKGGYGAPRILDRIDYDVIRRNPKIFVGYSDITALHTAIHKQAGLVTFHGPMVAELAVVNDPLTWFTLWRCITDPSPPMGYVPSPIVSPITLSPGGAVGLLTGGNLSLLATTLGTPYEIETKDKILFIEDVGEQPYRIDRMLTQLRLAGKLQCASGIVFTNFAHCEPENAAKSLTIEQVLRDIICPLGVPCFYGFEAGHCRPNFTLPIGVRAAMDADACRLELLEGAVT